MSWGHYGRPALICSIAIGIGLIAQLLLPFGVVEFRGPANPPLEWYRFFEAAEAFRDAPDAMSPATWSVGLIWIGIAIAALGAGILMVMGQQPLNVDPARWIGAVGGLLVVIGSAVMGMSAWYHVGTGFATFLGTIMASEFRAQFWAISPVIVAAASVVALHNGLKVMTKVCVARDGIRERATRHADATRRGMVLLAAILFVPWSIGILHDGLNDGFQTQVEDTPRAPLFFSAQDIQGVTLAELTPGGPLRYGSEDDWRWTKISLDVMLGAAWAVIAIGALGTFLGTARSVGAPASAETPMKILMVPMVIAWIAAGLAWLLTWFTFTPRPEAGLFLPGFWPILVAIVAFLTIRAQRPIAVGTSSDIVTA